MKHFIKLSDFSSKQILQFVRQGLEIKHNFKSNNNALQQKPLNGKTLGMIFTKKSTRTRISSETGWAYYGGHPMFLGKEDIQLSGGENLKDTAVVVSSMVDGILARVGEHDEIETLKKYSTVPVINALTAKFHPLQIIADLMTLYEKFLPNALSIPSPHPLPLLSGLKVAWVGDANNILNSMLVSFPRIGISLSAACPKGYVCPADVVEYANANSATGKGSDKENLGKVVFTTDPKVAVNNADVIVTDTWISMGQEEQMEKRLQEFQGYKVTEEMAALGNAKKNWIFMHCLPRKPYEVSDEVFYNPTRSVVFQEAENRKYAVMSVYKYLYDF